MSHRRILILDCTPKDEPSEGMLLKQFFRICKLFAPRKSASLFYSVRSKKEFLNKLNTSRKYDIIHISAHGLPQGIKDVSVGNGRSWSATPEDIRMTSHEAKLVFVNACVGGRKKMAKAFHSTYFLAPVSEVSWDDAALFSLTFYKRYIIDGVKIDSAFKFARRHTKTGEDYPYYWEGADS